ncbi:hypothetical protein [Burkholderia gladioli]|uniref:hypothetical protein n=1 Tax=Burkholderia gladioli TaxID=28095 RepID=UPI0012FC7BE3|nr:hypothetical protein [Burkholderia gladioli]
MTDIALTRKFGEPFPIFDSIAAACDAIIKAAFRLYVVMNPDHSADDFLREVLMPIAQSSTENPVQIEVQVFKNHTEHSFVIYMRAICHACAYVQEAKNSRSAGNEGQGWSHIANAHYLLGFAEGVFALEPALGRVISARSKAGSTKRNARYEPLREHARELAATGKYQSKRNAALSIKEAVLSKAADLNIELSKNQAERTITAWLDGMTFARKQRTTCS